MHFCIADARQLVPQGNNPYLGYDIHVNGVFHCTVRYKQLHNLHQQLHDHYPHLKLPEFPPKKLLPLTSSQVEERRTLLERYLQLVGQNSELSNSDLVIGFLASAQQEMNNEDRQDVSLDIYTMLGLKVPLNVSSTDRTGTVLEKACSHLSVPADLIKYFALYLAKVDDSSNEITIFKRLEDFESPYISQKTFKTKHKIYIRKSYWDISYDLNIMKDKASLELLYAQTVAEVMAGWVSMTPTVLNQLTKYQMSDQKAEYMELVRNERHYGCVLAGRGLAEWNAGGVPKGLVKILLCHLGLLLVTADQQEIFFKVVRMRCWRITALRPVPTTSSLQAFKGQNLIDSFPQNDSINDIQNGYLESECGHKNGGDPKLELSFEYLINKDSLQWITILSDRSMFMSVCLQSIIDELMGLKIYCKLYNEEKNKLNRSSLRKQNLTYLKRDGSSQVITPSSSTDTLSSTSSDSRPAQSPKERFSIKKLTEKFASVSFRSGHDFIENNAFGGIGDDDL